MNFDLTSASSADLDSAKAIGLARVIVDNVNKVVAYVSLLVIGLWVVMTTGHQRGDMEHH